MNFDLSDEQRQIQETFARFCDDKIIPQAADADVIGLSILSGAHLPLCRRIRDLLLDRGLHDKLWIVGGNIPETDRMVLRQLGYRGVFPTGSRTEEIVSFIRENLK